MSINICICGGGGLGHVIAGVAAHKGFNVSTPSSPGIPSNGIHHYSLKIAGEIHSPAH